MLHLGCGSVIKPGWLNIDLEPKDRDVMPLDLRRPLPFTESSVDFIYSEHFWEHISRDEGQALLKECHRVLKPGAMIRISTPDLAVTVSDYLAGKLDRVSPDVWAPATPAAMINESMRLWGHQFLYDWPEMARSLHSAGFRAYGQRQHGQSDEHHLSGIEARPNDGEALIVEAVR